MLKVTEKVPREDDRTFWLLKGQPSKRELDQTQTKFKNVCQPLEGLQWFIQFKVSNICNIWTLFNMFNQIKIAEKSEWMNNDLLESSFYFILFMYVFTFYFDWLIDVYLFQFRTGSVFPKGVR